MIPSITAISAVVTAVQGSTATLQCTASGEPVPMQSWMRNGVPVTTSARFQISADGGSLAVTSVRVEDGGVYTCHASSPAGADSATVTLDVQCKLSLIVQ